MIEFFIRLSNFNQFGPLAIIACLITNFYAGPVVAQSDSTPTTDELQGVKRQLEQSEQREQQINRELTTLEKEAQVISQKLINLAAKTQRGEENISSSEKKIRLLDDQQNQFGRKTSHPTR